LSPAHDVAARRTGQAVGTLACIAAAPALAAIARSRWSGGGCGAVRGAARRPA